MMITTKRKQLGAVLIGSILLLTGCARTEQTPLDRMIPHNVIAQTVDFSDSPEDIARHYTPDGQNWLRMAFPEPAHRDYALKHIGKKAPNVVYTPMKGKSTDLESLSGHTILYFTQTGTGVTKEMDTHMSNFQREHKDINVLAVYPNDTSESLKAYEDTHGLKIDESQTVIGDDAVALANLFSVDTYPLLVYVDDTQTIAYTAVGFRDLVYLNDHAESAFGDHPFYKWIDVSFEA